MNNDLTYVSIYNALTENDGLSLTALSRVLGFTKKSKIVSDMVDELYSEGFVESRLSDSGQYRLWFVSDGYEYEDFETFGSESQEEEDYDADCECCDEEDSVNGTPVDENVTEEEAPLLETVPLPRNLRGYNVKITQYGFDVTFPDSGNVHAMKATDRLLVINDTYRVRISTPEDVIRALESYSSEKGWRHYVVIDAEEGVPVSPSTLNLNPAIIFLSVERHSKAG